MLDIGWQELFVIAVVAIIFIGPKDLPHVVKSGTKWLRKAREMAREFQSGLDEMAREAELDDIKKEVQKATDYDIKKEVQNTIDPSGDLAKQLDLTGVERDLSDGAKTLAEQTDPTAAPAQPDPSQAPANVAGVESAPVSKPVNHDSMVERVEPAPETTPKAAGGTSG